MILGKTRTAHKTGERRVVAKFASIPFSPWADLELKTEQTVWMQNFYVVEKYTYSSMDGFSWEWEVPFVSRNLAERYAAHEGAK